MNKILPRVFDLPEELFEVNLPQSENPLINLCDGLVRKASLIQSNFKSNRIPQYMQHTIPQYSPKGDAKLPTINENSENRSVTRAGLEMTGGSDIFDIQID